MRLCALVVSASFAPCTWAAEPPQHEPDPAAVKAFAELIKATRARPAYQVEAKLTVEAAEGDKAVPSAPVEAVLRFDPSSKPAKAQLDLRGFDVRVHDGRIDITHASNEKEYASSEEDSPYYALLNEFMDLPYPQLGMVLGDEDPGEVPSQLNSRAAWILPTKVGSAELDGKKAKTIALTSDYEEMTLTFDPQSSAMLSMDLLIKGGPMVAAGATLRYRATFKETNLSPEDVKKWLTFDAGERHKVDMIAALIKRPDPPPGGGGGGQSPLIGQTAPRVELARFDDGDFDSAGCIGKKVVVLDFWATWCGPCRMALPKVNEAAKIFEQKKLPVTVVAVDTMEHGSPAEVREQVGKFWGDKGFVMTLVLDEGADTAGKYGVTGIPTTVIIDKSGKVAWVHTGYTDDLDEELVKAVEAALEEKPAAKGGDAPNTPAPKGEKKPADAP